MKGKSIRLLSWILIVYFTGYHCDIIQLSCHTSSGETFNRYIQPTQPITVEASKVTGLSTQHGNIYKHGEVMNTVLPQIALQQFNEWLNQFSKPVVLIAHNSNFDASVIINYYKKYATVNFPNVCGFFDTFKLFRHFSPVCCVISLNFW